MKIVELSGMNELLERLDKLEYDTRKMGRRLAKDIAEEIVKDLKDNAPVNTGTLVQSIKRVPEHKGWIQNVVIPQYGLFADTGSRPHPIPFNNRTQFYASTYGLTWGQFYGGIKKRGTKPTDYIKPSIDRAMTQVPKIVDKHIKWLEANS